MTQLIHKLWWNRQHSTRATQSLRTVLILCLAGLQAVSALIVVSLIYYGMERAILRQSEQLIEQKSEAAASRITNFFKPSVQVTEMLVMLLESGAINAQNDQDLEKNLFSILLASEQVSGIYFGRPNGTFVFVSKNDGTEELITKVITTKERGASSVYRDRGFLPLRRMVNPDDTFDPRTRPWYQSAVENAQLIWTDTYRFFTTGRPGLTVAAPVYNNGELLGVVGTDIELWKLGQTLEAENFGTTITTTIMSQSGQVIVQASGSRVVEDVPLSALASHGDAVAQIAFENHLERATPMATNLMQNVSGAGEERYLTYLEPLQGHGLPWLVGLHSPQAGLTGGLQENHDQLFWLAMLALVLMSFGAVPLSNRIRNPVLRFSDQSRTATSDGATSDLTISAPYAELENTGSALTEEISKRRTYQFAYQRTFEFSSRGMAQIDPETLRFLHVNGRLCEMLEVSKDQMLANNMREVTLGDGKLALDPFSAAILDDREFSIEAEFRVSGGKTVWLRLSALLIRDHLGVPDHACVIFDNVEASRQMKQQIEDLKRDMYHVGRINTMGQFAAGLAHELNQPLGALVHDIDSAKFMLNAKRGNHTVLSGILDDIDAHAHRAGEIIRALRKLVQKDNHGISSCALDRLLHQTLAIMEPEARSCGASIVMPAATGFIIQADRSQLAQVFVNLIRNALEAFGTASVKDGTVRIEAFRQNGQIVIRISDDGPGFPTHLKPFSQFETGRPDGLGLGLSICRSLVEANGGTIHHEKAEPHGACFVLNLNEVKTQEAVSA